MKEKIKNFLRRFSFKTGVVVLLLCIPCYIVSLVQIWMPISTTAKGVLFTVFFGLAKTFQYAGLTIVGVEGINKLKAKWRKKDLKD